MLACPGRRGLFSGSNFKQQMHVRILAARFRPRFAFRCPSTRGSRECRMRAAPAVSRAKQVAKTHTSIQVQRRTSDIPCAMALRLITRSPRRRIRLVTVAAGLTANRPGWIDFATDSLTPATGAGTTRLHRTQPPVFAKRLRRAKAPFVCAPFDRSRVLAQSSTRPATHLRA
jgi:hypothetical protein